MRCIACQDCMVWTIRPHAHNGWLAGSLPRCSILRNSILELSCVQEPMYMPLGLTCGHKFCTDCILHTVGALRRIVVCRCRMQS
jgi:hypothetical protein